MEKKYIELYKELYNRKPKYGRTSIKLYNDILPIVLKLKPCAILDYGCGKSELMNKITEETNIPCYRYDPVIEGCEKLPKQKIDFIVCTDVLQHVPLHDLDNVLKEITRFTKKCFFHIKCTEHPTLFFNGEPTNCTVYPKEWWYKYLNKYFDKIEYIPVSDETTVSFFTSDN